MMSGRLALGVAIVVVFSGCVIPIGGDTTETGQPSPSPDEPLTPTPTPTPDPSSSPPPGVTGEALVNATALVEAHARVLNETGYTAVGRGDTAIVRSGFLVDVTTRGRTVVAPGSRHYYEVRYVEAGPIDRVTERYANGTAERVHRTENGEVTEKTRQPRRRTTLASAPLLEPLLEGGDFTVTRVREVNGTNVYIIEADRTDNVTAVRDALPENAQEVRSFEATARLDAFGRVHSLNATIEFVIAGRNRTHRVGYTLKRIGVEEVPAPDWVNGSDNRSSSLRSAGASRCHCSRLVVSTSG
jgi:hypothetical protein